MKHGCDEGSGVAQTSEAAVAQVSKPAGRGGANGRPIWRRAPQQGWKPAPRTPPPGFARRVSNFGFRVFAITSLVGASWTTPVLAGSTNTHRFACTDYTQGKVLIVAADGKIEWEYQTTGCNDLWVLPSGNLLFNTGRGVKEVTRAKQVVFDYQSKSEIYACQRLTNGNTFIGECNSGRLLEVERSGRIAKEVRLLPEGKDGGHLYMRNARRLATGHYLVTHYGEQVVREYDADGKVVREIPAAGGPHSAARLPNGNTVITCGDLPGGARVFEVDAAGRTVWQVQGDDLPGIRLKFVAGYHRLPNGNTVICNWLGHGQLGQAPHLVEITPDKRVAWTFSDHQTMKTISSVQVLDVKGDAVRGEVIH